MRRIVATVFAFAILLSAASSGGQTELGFRRGKEFRLRVPLWVLTSEMPRFRLGDLGGIGPPSLALAVQAERLASVPEGEIGVHGWWSSISLDAEGLAEVRPRWGLDRLPNELLLKASPGDPPWISGAHFDATAFSDALLVEGVAGTASVNLGGNPGVPVRVPVGLLGGFFSAATLQPSGAVRVGFSRSVWLRNVISPGARVDEVALVHGELVDRGGTAGRYYGAFLDNGTGAVSVTEGFGLYLTPVPGETRYGIYQAGSEKNIFHGPMEIRSDLRVIGEILVGPEGVRCDPAAAYREVTAPARLSDLGPRTVVAMWAGGDGPLELAGAVPGGSVEIVRVDECPASPVLVQWAGGSASAECGSSLRLLHVAGTWRQVR